jgi:hypothetical protein
MSISNVYNSNTAFPEAQSCESLRSDVGGEMAGCRCFGEELVCERLRILGII